MDTSKSFKPARVPEKGFKEKSSGQRLKIGETVPLVFREEKVSCG